VCSLGEDIMPQANNTDKPLYLAVYKLIIYLYSIVHNLPKEHKYRLGNDIIDISWKTLDSLMYTNTLGNKDKHIQIKKTLAIFNTLKYRLRVLSDLKLLSHRQYAHIIKQTVEINKMLRGWYNWSKKLV
jgi:hypothetical protein